MCHESAFKRHPGGTAQISPLRNINFWCFEHIIRAASQISGDTEIVVIGSQTIHAQEIHGPLQIPQAINTTV
jgi:hypothetical protein